METMMLIAVGLATINSGLLIALLFVYGKIVLHTKAMYAGGLLVFALLLLAHNLLTVFAYLSMAPFFGAEALPFLSAMAAFELGGLLVLMKITL